MFPLVSLCILFQSLVLSGAPLAWWTQRVTLGGHHLPHLGTVLEMPKWKHLRHLQRVLETSVSPIMSTTWGSPNFQTRTTINIIYFNFKWNFLKWEYPYRAPTSSIFLGHFPLWTIQLLKFPHVWTPSNDLRIAQVRSACPCFYSFFWLRSHHFYSTFTGKIYAFNEVDLLIYFSVSRCTLKSHPYITFSRTAHRNRKKSMIYPIGSMYAIYGNIYHQYIPNVSIYAIHGSYGYHDFAGKKMAIFHGILALPRGSWRIIGPGCWPWLVGGPKAAGWWMDGPLWQFHM